MCLKCKCFLLFLEEQESYKAHSEDQPHVAVLWLPPVDGFSFTSKPPLTLAEGSEGRYSNNFKVKF